MYEAIRLVVLPCLLQSEDKLIEMMGVKGKHFPGVTVEDMIDTRGSWTHTLGDTSISFEQWPRGSCICGWDSLEPHTYKHFVCLGSLSRQVVW